MPKRSFTTEEFWHNVDKRMDYHQRIGQAAYNAVDWWLTPELAKEIDERDIDPFFDDDKLGLFVAFLYEKGVIDDSGAKE